MWKSYNVVFIMSVISTADDNPKFPNRAFTATKDVIGPTVVIEPGTAIGVAGDGTPKLNPPNAEVNPYGPADTPIPASILDSAVSESHKTDPST